MLAFLVQVADHWRFFLAEVKAVQPHLVVHECTGQFLRAVFEEHLPEYDIYVIHKPEDMTRLRE